VAADSLWTFLRRFLRGRVCDKTDPEDGQATVGSPKRPVMVGVDAATETAHVGISTFPTEAEDTPSVVHPSGCPICGSSNLFRRARHWEEIEQTLDRIENFYGGVHGLRAAVAAGVPQKVVAAGVTGHHIRCGDCDHTAEILDFVTEVRGG
jgi:hypothetical protein